MTRPADEKKRHRSRKDPFHRIRIPGIATTACHEYFLAYRQIIDFYHFVIHMVGQIDYAANVAHEGLVEVQADAEKRRQMEDSWKQRKGAVDELRRQRQFLVEILLVRHVENYLNFLSALLFEIFIQRPETLRSSDKIAVEEVLRHESIDGVVRAVAERKVDALSYSSLRDLAAFFQERFGLSLVTEADMPIVVHGIEVRNLSVHNRCIVNQRFLARTGDNAIPVGKQKALFVNYRERLVPLLCASVRQLDMAARRKLRLKATRLRRDHEAA